MASYFCTPPTVWTRDRVTVGEDEERKRGKKIDGREGLENTPNHSASLFSEDTVFSYQ